MVTTSRLHKDDALNATLQRIKDRLSQAEVRDSVRSRQITLFPWQQQVINEARRFNVPNIGRRAGKTELTAYLSNETGIEGYPLGWFAPTYKILDDAWIKIKRVLEPIIAKKDESKYRLDLIGGGVIECWSLERNPDAGRSREYKRVIIDEAAKVVNLEEAWTKAIRPTLTNLRGDAWFPSTPRGMGYYKTLYDRGQDPLDTDWMSWQLPTLVNPLIDPAEIEDAKRDLPQAVFDQEYLAIFNEFSGSVFRNIYIVCVGEPIKEAELNHHYVFGVDWGKENDFTVISVWDICCHREVWLERFNKIDYQFQLSKLSTLKDRYRPVSMIVEANSMGAPLVEQLDRAWPNLVIPFWTNNASKRYVIEGLALMMDRQTITMLDDIVGVAELQTFESKRIPTGYTYDASKGAHDDTVIARALGASPLIETVPTAGVLVQDHGMVDTEDDSSDEYAPVLVF